MTLAPERLIAVPHPPVAEWAAPNRRSNLVFGIKVLAIEPGACSLTWSRVRAA
ncbi:MAG TPA: hypothetical protein VN808_06535 [Stellaceae bacterium]|nr:hypothetical protein [Stellaceae bacterium]